MKGEGEGGRGGEEKGRKGREIISPGWASLLMLVEVVAMVTEGDGPSA